MAARQEIEFRGTPMFDYRRSATRSSATRSAAAESTEDLSAPEHIRTWVNDSQFSRETKRF